MKKTSMVLGIAGGVIGLIVSSIYINISAGGIDMSGFVGSIYLRQFIFGIVGVAGAVSAIIGASIVFKKKILSGILMFAGAISGLYSLLGIFTFIILLLGGIFAMIKDKPHVLSNKDRMESEIQINEDSSPGVITSEKGIAGVVPGVIFGVVLLLISYFLICMTFWTDANMPADPVLYEEMMEDAARIYPFEVFLIVLGGIGTLGGFACITVPVLIKRSRRSAGTILGFVGSSIIIITVIITIVNGKVPLTYPSVTPFAYSAVALSSSILGFVASSIIKKKNLVGGILLLGSGAALSFEIYLQTMVFTGAGALLLLIGGLLAIVKERNMRLVS